MFGFRIGDISISFNTIVSAVVLLLIGFAATRFVQRWLERRFLPRTGLDPGLQNSVSVLFGYAGGIIALIFALSALGIDLQKIALIAGALSVGIGFGLQRSCPISCAASFCSRNDRSGWATGCW